ncbi:hypothetical protein [Serinibacter arcticus]|uniref:hypothetical protein n=1 Tax=Serinibacter arcticus TaxID=1655435 RepID=UPI001F3CA82B|nr:hypothetical protein [Serinibacter arcticus]
MPQGRPETTGDLASVLATLARTVEQNARQPLLTQLHSVIVADSLTEGHAAKEPMRRRYREARSRVAAPLAADASLEGDVDRAPAIAALILAALDGLQIQWLLDPDAVDMQASFAVLEEALLGLRKDDDDR